MAPVWITSATAMMGTEVAAAKYQVRVIYVASFYIGNVHNYQLLGTLLMVDSLKARYLFNLIRYP